MACCEPASSLPATKSAYEPALARHWNVSLISTLPPSTTAALAQAVAKEYPVADYGTAADAFVAADSDVRLPQALHLHQSRLSLANGKLQSSAVQPLLP